MPSIYDESITAVYADLVTLREVDDNGNVKYKATEDTTVNTHKAYYSYSAGVYTRVSTPAGNPSAQNWYEQICVRMTNCGEWVTFDGFDYMPCAFEITMPDTTAVSEESGSLNIAGVTGDYVEMIQTATGTLLCTDGIIRVKDAAQGAYLIQPVEIEVKGITINSAQAAISVSMKSGGILSYYASKHEYTLNKFPGISG